MTSNNSGNSSGKDDELLPWLAMGHHGDSSDHTAASADMSDHARQIREEATAVVADNEARGLPSAAVLDRVMASIEQDAGRQAQSRRASWMSRIEGWLDGLRAPTIGRLAAVGAAVLVIAAQAAVIGYLLTGPSQQTYQTASGQQTSEQTGPEFLVRFDSEATARDISAALSAAGARIIDGPRAGGFYRVALSAPDRQSIDDAEDALRGSDVVMTLLPAGGGE